jgi:hypothetical protein
MRRTSSVAEYTRSDARLLPCPAGPDQYQQVSRRPTTGSNRGSSGAAQGIENGEIILLGPIAQGGEDVDRAIETFLGQRLPEVVSNVAQPRRRKAPPLSLGVVEECLRLVDAQHDCAAFGQRAREASIATGSVEDTPSFLKAEERPQPVALRRGDGARSVTLSPQTEVLGVEEPLPPVAHRIPPARLPVSTK